MIILDHEKLECLYDLPLQRNCSYHATVYIVSVELHDQALSLSRGPTANSTDIASASYHIYNMLEKITSFNMDFW